MKQIYFYPIIFAACLLFNSCCTIQMPPVSFTSERTSLENQIMGTYQEIREDVWLVSSSQTVEGLKIESTTNSNVQTSVNVDFRIIKAIETIEYNEDQVAESKKNGYIGENNKAQLSYREHPEIEKNPMEKQKLFEIIDEVNDARQVLMLEVINKNENLTIEDMDKVREIFTEKYKKEAKKGEWIQNQDGSWIKKQ